MKKQLSFVLLIALLLQVCGFTGLVYATPMYSTVTCSGGSATVEPGSATGSIIDDGITLSNGVNLTGAKVYITSGFDSATDELTFTNTGSITGSYSTDTGTLTLTGSATPADYQAALRTVKIITDASADGQRTVVFSLGGTMEYDGHYYEYVNSGTITWTAAQTAAAARTFYGQNGYLTTITSQEENDFLDEKIAADAWIGCSDATTEGAWYWVTGPEAGTLFSTGVYGSITTYDGIYSNWATNQPDNYTYAGSKPDGEDYGQMYSTGANPGKWNDLLNDESITGYLVEYTSATGASSSRTVNVAMIRTLSYDGNVSDGGSVPASGTDYADGTEITVLGNTGNLTQAGKSFGGWNTAADGSGTTYYPGGTFDISADTILYAIWADESTIDCSAGTSSVTVGSTAGTSVDGSLTIANGAMITGAKAYITTGFDSANDTLSFTATTNITGTYDAGKGTLTMTGTASPAEYQTALRSVVFKSSGAVVGTRTINFALGNKLANGGHNYEYVNNGGAISWTAAEAAAELRTYYGQQGYLATITSQTENDFLTDKLGADAWIGASDAAEEGAWKWATGPETGDLISTGTAPGTVTPADGAFNNWNSGEPNNAGNEHYAEIYCSGDNPGKWNDLANGGSVTGYLVEYDSVTGASDTKDVSIVAQSSGSGHGSNTDTNTSGVDVIVNGQVQSAGKQTESIQDGVKTSEVDVDETVVSAKIDAVLAAQQAGQSQENIIEVPVVSDAQNIQVALTGDIVKKMDDNAFTLNVSYDDVSYLIPAAEIKISELADQLDAGKLTDIEIKVQFKAPDAATLAKIEEQAQAKDYEIVIPPLNFELIAVNTSTNQQINISKFVNYVERMFEIPANVDPDKITTGIVYNADGTFSHIPTQIVKIGDKYYAKLNSLTNSTYSVIWNPIVFADMENHWAKEAANDMGSRLVVNGVGNGNFDPDRAITRGEFAAIITKALGIYRTGAGTDQYTDVSKENIFYDAIGIADEYGLITGYTSGLYEPDKSISREEAMAILTRAADIVKLETTGGKTAADFIDSDQVSDWAKAYVAANLEKGIIIGDSGMIRPNAVISRAEVVTAIERILTETELINSIK